MIKLSQIIATIENSFPLTAACDWDFVGLQIKSTTKQKINKILLALDINHKILTQAITNNVDLIICHHPLVFAENINSSTISLWKKALYDNLVKADINVYCIHTNFDTAINGMNMLMAHDLLLQNTAFLNEERLTVIGNLAKPLSNKSLIAATKKYFNVKKNQLLGNPDQLITKIALAAGAGGATIKDLPATIDLFITGEMKWNQILEANDKKLNVMIVGHQMEEKFVDFISEFLNKLVLKNIKIIKGRSAPLIISI